MNIFILSLNLKRCAKYYCDKHVLKILLELAQMLCTCIRLMDAEMTNLYDLILYKKTHINHPCNKWIRTSSENYKWTVSLFNELCKEYTYRYEKIHACQTKFSVIFSQVPKDIPNGPMTDFALAMPVDYKCDDAVKSYRTYYINDKKDICTWKKRPVPYWFKV